MGMCGMFDHLRILDTVSRASRRTFPGAYFPTAQLMTKTKMIPRFSVNYRMVHCSTADTHAGPCTIGLEICVAGFAIGGVPFHMKPYKHRGIERRRDHDFDNCRWRNPHCQLQLLLTCCLFGGVLWASAKPLKLWQVRALPCPSTSDLTPAPNKQN